jgi:hypothetical protein
VLGGVWWLDDLGMRPEGWKGVDTGKLPCNQERNTPGVNQSER